MILVYVGKKKDVIISWIELFPSEKRDRWMKESDDNDNKILQGRNQHRIDLFFDENGGISIPKFINLVAVALWTLHYFPQ